MSDAAQLNGYLLCGGASRRRGEDKARLPHPDGGTLIERAVRLADSVSDRVSLLSGRPPRFPDLNLTELADRQENRGPLGGICAALADTGARPALILPVDLPRLEVEHLTLLCEAYWREMPPLALAAADDGLHPVLGIWSPSCRETAELALQRGELKLQDLVRALGVLPVALPADALLNWNGPGDLPDEGSDGHGH